MYIYVITNNTTGKIYIGQHKGTNLRKYLQTKLSDASKHRGGQSLLYNSMRKHPKDVWSIEPLMELETKAELDRWERLLIALYDTRNTEVGYNICRGGEGFSGKHTDEWRKNHSAMMKGRVFSPETIARMKTAPKTQVQLDNLKSENRVVRINERYATDPSYRAKVAKAGRERWSESTPEYQVQWSEQLAAAARKRWETYREGVAKDPLTMRIIDLHREGLSHRAIAHELGIGKDKVYRRLKSKGL